VKANKVVLLPIKVPAGKFCWDYNEKFIICRYFDNEGGCPTCALRLGDLGYEEPFGVLKPEKCLGLEAVK